MNCIQCGSENSPGVKFCRGCGNKMEAVEPIVAGRFVDCPKCGETIEVGKKFCPKCGVSLAAAAPIRAAPVPTQPIATRAPANSPAVTPPHPPDYAAIQAAPAKGAMNKAVIAGVIAVVLLAMSGGGGYWYYQKQEVEKAIALQKQQEEEARVRAEAQAKVEAEKVKAEAQRVLAEAERAKALTERVLAQAEIEKAKAQASIAQAEAQKAIAQAKAENGANVREPRTGSIRDPRVAIRKLLDTTSESTLSSPAYQGVSLRRGDAFQPCAECAPMVLHCGTHPRSIHNLAGAKVRVSSRKPEDISFLQTLVKERNGVPMLVAASEVKIALQRGILDCLMFRVE